MATKKPRTRAKAAPAASKYEAISVTVPAAIVREVRARTAKRDLSRFVATAIARELTREARTDFLIHAEAERPVDDAELRAAISALTS